MVQYDINHLQKITLKNVKQGKRKMDLSKELDKVIERMKSRIEREIPDTGYFRNFAENFEKGTKPDFFGRDISLFIERDEARDGRAYLGVSVLHPEMCLDASTYLMNGNRNKILEYINNKEFKEELKNDILELAESLKKME